MALLLEQFEQKRFPSSSVLVRSDRESKAIDIPKVVDILQEVNLILKISEKKRLLYHQFRAQVKEEIGLPFHSYGMAMKSSAERENQLEFHDHLYFNSSVVDRCQKAIDVAKDSIEEIRFVREKAQLEQLITLINENFIAMDHAFLRVLGAEEPSTLPDRMETIKTLLLGGWRTAPLITPEIAWQFNIKPKSTCVAGPKFFYIMPKSPVHHGWKTMYLIAQPVYIPETDQWLVIQDQHMCDGSWEDYDRVLSMLQYSISPHSLETSDTREGRVMSECIQLEEKYQCLPATEVFADLLYHHLGKNDQLEHIYDLQEQLMVIYRRLESDFDLHSDYLLQILELENDWESDWTQSKRERLFQAYFNTYSSLYHQQGISKDLTEKWLDQHQKIYNNPKNRTLPFSRRKEYRLSSAVNAPWLLLSIEAKLECSLLAMPSLLLKSAINPSLLHAVKGNSLSFSQLESIIGKERAGRWKLGTCVACGERGVWIGDKNSGKECDVCIKCEMISDGLDFNDQPQTNTDIYKNKPRLNISEPSYQESGFQGFFSNQTINLTQLLANL